MNGYVPDPVKWQLAANIATVCGVLLGLTTLFFIAKQLRYQARLARAANSQALVALSSQFVLQVAQSAELAKLWLLDGERYDQLSDDHRAQYRYLASWWLTFFENVEYQHRAGLLDDGVYDAWCGDMQGFVDRRCVEKFWDDLRGNYSKQFVAAFQPLIDAKRRARKQGSST